MLRANGQCGCTGFRISNDRKTRSRALSVAPKLAHKTRRKVCRTSPPRRTPRPRPSAKAICRTMSPTSPTRSPCRNTYPHTKSRVKISLRGAAVLGGPLSADLAAARAASARRAGRNFGPLQNQGFWSEGGQIIGRNLRLDVTNKLFADADIARIFPVALRGQIRKGCSRTLDCSKSNSRCSGVFKTNFSRSQLCACAACAHSSFFQSSTTTKVNQDFKFVTR